jgi:hypothetical protein
VVFGVLFADADAAAEGDGESANATGAVPLTRTNPVPTQMISGLRTDRASTAADLLNDRLDADPTLRHGSGKNHAITSGLSNQPGKGVVFR